jgi:hypothetical protein
MARRKVTKSAAIREVLRENRKLSATEVVAALAAKGIRVKAGLVYFVKGHMKGRRGRRRKARRMAAEVVAVRGNSDPVATILKVTGWASEVGGLKKLKALVDALSG